MQCSKYTSGSDIFFPKILFLLPKLYHLNFLFSVERQKLPPGLLDKKAALENFAKLAGKHLCRSTSFNEVADLRSATLIKKRLRYRRFPAILLNLRTAVYRNICERQLLKRFTIHNHKKNTLPNFFNFLLIIPRFKQRLKRTWRNFAANRGFSFSILFSVWN